MLNKRLKGFWNNMKTYSEKLSSTIQSLLSASVSESFLPLNEGGGDIRQVADDAIKAAQKIWDRALKSQVEPRLKALDFSRKSYEFEFKSGTFEAVYSNDKLKMKVKIWGSFFGGSDVSHYLSLDIYGPNGLIDSGGVEYFSSLIERVRYAVNQTGGNQ
jgi:hypothetical protein